MKNTKSYRGYIGTREWSEEDKVYHGKVSNVNALITYEALDENNIQEEFEQAIDDYLEAINFGHEH